ncbi:uncharacterized protein LOC125461311 isoform X2 [Stegostoma tigrinum]|uniref:uncharacterized protein LOC125461311 isoform X2 n=1 Tax=Stegostoma tigrinum TaxID=3053191 RepID=UPI00202AF801|nr:uncharacterized protein LOC125461311 isoform X2 [Stegostoma tigrinum]
MVFQSVCLLVPTYRRLQIVLCVILLCDVNSSTIPSGADKESTGGSGNIVYEGFWLKMASQTKEEAKRTYEEDLEGLFRVCDKMGEDDGEGPVNNQHPSGTHYDSTM